MVSLLLSVQCSASSTQCAMLSVRCNVLWLSCVMASFRVVVAKKRHMHFVDLSIFQHLVCMHANITHKSNVIAKKWQEKKRSDHYMGISMIFLFTQIFKSVLT